MCQAQSNELSKYGVEAGLTNYAAGYATGLLAARRLLDKVGMSDMYKGVAKVDGEDYDASNDCGERRPFKCFLDIGLQRSTTGARVYAALKGAVDGGLHIPHEHKRFAGYRETREEVQLKRGKTELEQAVAHWEPAVLRDHIMGVHVQNYMDKLKKESQDRYEKQFGGWIKVMKKSKVTKLADMY